MRVATLTAVFLLASVLPVAARAAQIVISQPAEATTMDPGRSTQVLTVNYFVNLYDTPRADFRLIVSEMTLSR